MNKSKACPFCDGELVIKKNQTFCKKSEKDTAKLKDKKVKYG